MSEPVRVLVRYTAGRVWTEASDKERKKLFASWSEDIREWRREMGTGVRYLCYYADPGPGHLDGYQHHTVFEVDDASKVAALSAFYAGFPYDRLAVDVVSSAAWHDELWTS